MLTRAGSSPFTGAVAGSGAGRHLVLQITRLPSGGAFPVCIGVRWRPVVVETTSTVTITLAGYAPREGSGQCVDGLDAPVPFPVRLSAPLADRRLVDGSDGSVHTVFDGSSMPLPAPGSLPDGVVGEPVRWDERTGVAMQRWRSAGSSPAGAHDVWISVGPAAGIAAGAPVPSRTARRVDVGGTAGQVWHEGGPYDVVVVRFRGGADTVEVRTVQDEGSRGTVAAALRIARALG